LGSALYWDQLDKLLLRLFLKDLKAKMASTAATAAAGGAGQPIVSSREKPGKRRV
jgi:hypothetical protein